jgi:hypothetical protein
MLGVQLGLALEFLELSAHFGHHRVPRHESEPSVGDVENVVTAEVDC